MSVPPTPGPTAGGSDLERQALTALRRLREQLAAVEAARHEPMAIVGMACRLPGAPDLEAFWQLLCRGGDAIVDIPAARWDAEALAREAAHDHVHVPRQAGLLPRIDAFDAEFFGIAGREAQQMDPQQRLFLEVTWQALESAGIPPLALKGSRTGVFVGATTSDYLQLLMQRLPREELDAYLASGNTLNAIPGRVSYTLGLQGPSLAIDSACSSSLVAIDRACRSLRDGESRLAIAGGVNLVLSPEFVMSMSRWGMLAPDARCKAFDNAANGFVRAEGCGVVLIKRLADARADGDRIWALLRGWAVNQGGASGGFSVPNGLAQADVLRDALASARLAPAAVGYVEAHGTGTPLGDPIEMEAIAKVYGQGRREEDPLWVGAVKTNIGHLESAAGVAGVLKAVLALQHRQIPPNLHFHEPSPNIPWDRIPVRVPTRLEPWAAIDGRRLAGVSSFGFSGTNAHVLLEEAPEPAAAPSAQGTPALLLTLSARSPIALQTLALRHAERLEAPGVGVEDARTWCLAASASRSHLAQRLAVSADDAATLATRLRAAAAGEPVPGAARGRVGTDRPGVAFLFTGQGAQHPGMGRRLAQASPVFRAALERCAAVIDPLLDRPLLPLIFDAEADPSILARTGYAQPALFAIGVALVDWWRSVGVVPAVVLGHSVGEFAAACCAGVLSLEDAARLVTLRGALMQALPEGGAMAAVFADEEAVRARMAHVARTAQTARMAGSGGVLAIAGLNGPAETVISGDAAAVRALADSFTAAGVRVEPLAVSHAFHSPLMQPMLARFEEAARRVAFKPPALAVVSSMTGREADADWGTPAYWVRQLMAPVRWHDALRCAMALEGIGIALEIGPQPVLTGLGRRGLPEAPVVWVAPLRRGQDEAMTATQALGELYVHGAVDDWSGPAGAAARAHAELPAYPFQPTRHWVDAPPRGAAAADAAAWIHPLLGAPLPLAGGDTVFQARAGERRHAWVRDHRMRTTSVWPGAASLEMLLCAARTAGRPGDGLAIELHEVELRAPLALAEDERVLLQTVLRPGAARGEWAAEICRELTAPSGPTEAPRGWPVLVTARLQVGAAPAAPALALDALRARCSRPIDPAAFYGELAAAGAPFGEAFRSLQSIAHDDDAAAGEAIGRIGLGGLGVSNGFEQVTDDAAWLIHPVLLDGGLQLVTAAASARAGTTPGLWLPMSVQRLVLHGPARTTLWGHARLQRLHPGDGDAHQRLVAELSLWNDDGSPVATLEGLRFVRGRAEDLLHSEASLVERSGLELVWERGAVADLTTSAHWQLVGGSGALAPELAAALRARGGTATSHATQLAAPAPAEGVESAQDAPGAQQWIHLGGLDLPAATDADGAAAALRPVIESALALARSAAACAVPPRLWLVTRGAQVVQGGERVSPLAASLWGLARVLRAEHPALRCTVLDIDAEGGDVHGAERGADDRAATLAPRLARLLCGADERESQLALRGDEPWRARLAPLPAPSDCALALPASGHLEDLRLAPVTARAPGPGEVRIEVQAAGLNFRDVLRALGMVEGLVDALGGECAGVVAAVGPGVTRFAPGDSVFAIAPGALASSVCVAEQLVAHRPAQLRIGDAAAMPIACLTASYGFEDLAGLRRGERVLIHAATGGVGLAAVQLARHLGAEIHATAGSEDKRALLRSMGVRHVYDSRSLAFRDEVRTATAGQGVHVVLNALAGEFIEAGLSLVAPGGCFLELGKRGTWAPEAVAERFPGIRYHVYDLGTVAMADAALSQRLFARLIARLQAGELTPLPVAAYAMRDAAAAFQTMAHARHVGKLVLMRDAAAPALPLAPPRGDATYLVSGGFGALGLAVAQGLAARGARHLVLLGRGAPSAETETALARLEAGGVQVRRARLDIADGPALRALLADCAATLPPLAGIVHAAGVLDDGVVEQQDWHRFETVLRPKLFGALQLAAATAALPLDFFVLFSAGAAWIGAPGQSNYAAANAALDALALALRAQGRHATSIAWGRWAGAGMAAARASDGGRGWEAAGIGAIEPAAGVAAMFELIHRSVASVAVLPMDWPTWLHKVHGPHAPACFDRLLPSAAPGPADASATVLSALQALQALPSGQRREALQQRLDAIVRKVVGLPAGRDIDPREPLRELGMDSLMTIELRNTIGGTFARTLSATLVFDHPTLEALTTHLLAMLPGLADGAAEAAAAATAAPVRDARATVRELSEDEAEAELLAELAKGATT
ncbi:MAG: type I polyketide synthase [Burkholderiales bacterium]|nr:type I polyketide synthase [Burkholderiales bacterium]